MFRFSHTSTFELTPSVATAQPGAWVTIGGEYGLHGLQLGNNWCRIRLVPTAIGDSRCRQRAGNVVSTIGGQLVEKRLFPIGLFRHLEMFTDRDSRDDKESLTQRALRLEERKMVTLPNNEH